MRLGLSCDGFNPFKYLNTNHDVWPVFTHVYNLPPWICMKKFFTFGTVLIPGQMEEERILSYLFYFAAGESGLHICGI